jgi:hypothetical protein
MTLDPILVVTRYEIIHIITNSPFGNADQGWNSAECDF